MSPVNSETWATGGYDHVVKLWDVRGKGDCTMTLEHGSPVEDLAFFSSGEGSCQKGKRREVGQAWSLSSSALPSL